MKFFNKLLRDEQGATAIEYGLIAALIAVAAIRAAMRPYSMAVAPCSSRSSLLKNFMVVSWFSLRYPT